MNLMLGDCLERMKEIPDGSVDMILTDPPYGTVKGAKLDGWKGSKTDWDVCIEHKEMLSECNRVLRTNGALLLFSQDPYTAKLMTDTHGNLPFGYRLTWLKDHFANPLFAKKAPVNYTEDICVFFKKHTKRDFEGTHPLRAYADKVLHFTGLKLKEINKKLKHRRAEHFFYVETTQFELCTEHTYDELIVVFGIDKMAGFKLYSDLKPVDDEYRADLIERMTNASPKIFNLPSGQKFKSNVLEYKKDYTGHHPTQKPVLLMEDLIKTYTNEGDSVLDFTMGSGTTGVACANLNREFIGIEMDEGYFNIANERIQRASDSNSIT